MNITFERIQSAAMVVAATTIALVLVHREFFSSGSAVRREPQRIESVRGWRDIVPAGRLIGDTGAPIKIIEFADLECPFCRRFSATLRSVAAKYPKDVAIVFVHFPLTMHRFAQPAAKAAECAAEQGRFAEMVDVLYAGQDSLGLKPWAEYAKASGVADSSRFGRCVTDGAVPSAIVSGIAMGRKLKVAGTPTVLVNDERFAIVPADSELVAVIEKIRRVGIGGPTPRK